MINNMFSFLLVFLFWLPLIVEGVGIGFIHGYIVYFYILLPAILYWFLLFKKKPIVFPKKITASFLLFILFSFISSLVFSVDKKNSFELTLFYLAAFFIFIFFYNLKNEGKKIIWANIILGGFFFIGYFILAVFHPFLKSFQSNGYQLVVSFFGSHNHLGDWLGLLLLYSLFSFLEERKKPYLWLTFLVFPFFLVSFSRSAYAAFLITLLIGKYFFLKIKEKSKLLLMTLTIFLSLVVVGFFLSTVKEAQSGVIFKPLAVLLSEKFQLAPKDFLGNRTEYLNQAVQSFYEKPFFGFGPGNFSYASNQYRSTPSFWTETGHNLFLEILVENGTFALLGLTGFIWLVFISQKQDIKLFLLFLYLLLNFQADYTYRIYSFFILFIILAAIIYEEKEQFEGQTFYGTAALLFFFFINNIFLSHLLLKMEKPRLAVFAYPFNKQAYQDLIAEKEKKGDFNHMIKIAKTYEKMFPYDAKMIDFVGQIYEKYQKKQEALNLYERAHRINPYADFSFIKNYKN